MKRTGSGDISRNRNRVCWGDCVASKACLAAISKIEEVAIRVNSKVFGVSTSYPKRISVFRTVKIHKGGDAAGSDVSGNI